MRAYTTIIVEQQSAEHWTAWLADYPQLSAGGEWPSDAIQRLLLTFGANEFVTDEISAINEAARAGHLEFRIPMKRLKKIPGVSVN